MSREIGLYVDRRHMSFLLTVAAALFKVLPCPRDRHRLQDRDPSSLRSQRPSRSAVVAGACKDPNPTFVFDASSDGAKDAVTDGTGSADASGGTGGGGGGAGGGGGGGAAGAAGGGSGGAAAGAGGQAGGNLRERWGGRSGRGREVRRDSLYETHRLLRRPGALGRRPRPDAAARGPGTGGSSPPTPRRAAPRRPTPPDPPPRRTFPHPPRRPRRQLRTRRVWTRSSRPRASRCASTSCWRRRRRSGRRRRPR